MASQDFKKRGHEEITRSDVLIEESDEECVVAEASAFSSSIVLVEEKEEEQDDRKQPAQHTVTSNGKGAGRDYRIEFRENADGDVFWSHMFRQLGEYKKEHGNCSVPTRYQENPKLAVWVKKMRKISKSGELSDHRRDKLASIAFFDYDPRITDAWDDMFQQLVDYKKEHGRCHLKINDKEHPKLARWVAYMRRTKNDQLSTYRRGKLASIGFFEYKPHALPRTKLGKQYEAKWEGSFQQLVEYKKEHGDCRVPLHPDTRKLARWAAHMRYLSKKDGQLSAARKSKLDSIGFFECSGPAKKGRIRNRRK